MLKSWMRSVYRRCLCRLTGHRFLTVSCGDRTYSEVGTCLRCGCGSDSKFDFVLVNLERRRRRKKGYREVSELKEAS